MQNDFVRWIRTNAFLAAAVFLASANSLGQDYPSRPIRIVVPFSAGAGVVDIMARLVGQQLSTGLGQPVLIENRPGAGGIPGTEIASKAPPDGYTVLMTNVSLVVGTFLYPSLPFDAQRDFVPVTMVNSAPLLLAVNPTLPVSSVKELIAYSRAHPGQLNYGSGGVGSTPHLCVELLKSMSGLDAIHVPYKGGAPALSDLVGGQLSFMIENMPGTMPFVRSGKLRAIAISSAKRSPLAPELPTIAESGVPGYEVVGWNGLFVPKGTAPAVIARLHSEVAKVLRAPEVRQRLETLGAEPVGSTPEEFGKFFREDIVRWGKIIKEKGIRSE